MIKDLGKNHEDFTNDEVEDMDIPECWHKI